MTQATANHTRHPDAKLLKDCGAIASLQTAIVAAGECEEQIVLIKAQFAALGRVERCKAKTAAGLRAKAEAVLASRSEDKEPYDIDFRISLMIVRELLIHLPA